MLHVGWATVAPHSALTCARDVRFDHRVDRLVANPIAELADLRNGTLYDERGLSATWYMNLDPIRIHAVTTWERDRGSADHLVISDGMESKFTTYSPGRFDNARLDDAARRYKGECRLTELDKGLVSTEHRLPEKVEAANDTVVWNVAGLEIRSDADGTVLAMGEWRVAEIVERPGGRVREPTSRRRSRVRSARLLSHGAPPATEERVLVDGSLRDFTERPEHPQKSAHSPPAAPS